MYTVHKYIFTAPVRKKNLTACTRLSRNYSQEEPVRNKLEPAMKRRLTGKLPLTNYFKRRY